MRKIKSVLLIDNNDIDNFINHKLLENYGITHVIAFKNATAALSYLSETNVKYHLILVDIYLTMIDGFEFIDKFNKLGLHKTQGKICILSSSINPADKEKAADRNINFIEKPLTIEKLLIT